MGLIYRVTNRVNGKTYIGQTTKPLEIRWKQHLYWARRGGKGSLLCKAIQCHGSDAFAIEKIVECEQVYLNCFEVYFIVLNRSLSTQNGYNITPGGDGLGAGELSPNFGKKYSAEWRGNISAARKGMKFSDEHRKNLSKSHGKHNAHVWTDESKKKLSKTRTGMKFSDEHRANIRKAAHKTRTGKGRFV